MSEGTLSRRPSLHRNPRRWPLEQTRRRRDSTAQGAQLLRRRVSLPYWSRPPSTNSHQRGARLVRRMTFSAHHPRGLGVHRHCLPASWTAPLPLLPRGCRPAGGGLRMGELCRPDGEYRPLETSQARIRAGAVGVAALASAPLTGARWWHSRHDQGVARPGPPPSLHLFGDSTWTAWLEDGKARSPGPSRGQGGSGPLFRSRCQSTGRSRRSPD
mmetsp:Transcript_33083/g.95809  ORF Transcript_33083/g.95809 Transcript_33083/m.95809 type:complete len:214 (-) Transcript_33083:47-688(-)